MSLATDLLEQAEHLAKRENKRPKQASLRRSISAAYYALFHLLVSEATATLGPNLSVSGAQKIQRWFNHSEMKQVCRLFATHPSSNINAVLGTSVVSPELVGIARSFVTLQEARHKADYDLDASFSRVNALQYHQLAKDAFVSWKSIKRTHEANVFALALLSNKLFDKERR